MLLRERDLDRYASDVNAVCEAASSAAQAAYREARMASPGATVAEVRETLIAIAESLLAAYGDASGEVGAEAYDEMARACGAGVEPAEVADPDPKAYESIDGTARYIVGALVPDREDI